MYNAYIPYEEFPYIVTVTEKPQFCPLKWIVQRHTSRDSSAESILCSLDFLVTLLLVTTSFPKGLCSRDTVPDTQKPCLTQSPEANESTQKLSIIKSTYPEHTQRVIWWLTPPIAHEEGLACSAAMLRGGTLGGESIDGCGFLGLRPPQWISPLMDMDQWRLLPNQWVDA